METKTITPELAITEFGAHLVKAEIVPEINITDLHALADKAKALVDIDITDDAKMKEVAIVRKELVSARRKIESDGKLARDEHTKINKAILQVQNVLVGILEEDEDRLKEFERQRKEKDMREERLKTLPQRLLLLLLKDIGDTVVVTEDAILDMDDATFLNYVTERQTAKMEADAFAEQARLAEEARKEQEAQRIKEAEDRVRLETEQKAKVEQEAKDNEATAKAKAEIDAKEAEIARMKQEQADRDAEVEHTRLAEVARVEAETQAKEKLESEAKFQQWLVDNKFDAGTDVLDGGGVDVYMYRLVAVYSKEI